MKEGIFKFVLGCNLLSASLLATQVCAENSSVPFPSTEMSNKELPSSVTVITRGEIEALGLTNIQDVFRLIPGMSVTQTATSRQNVSYHGTNSIFPRRTMVLVDGMSLHRTGNSSIQWYAFPISIEDIERVEIYRNHVYPKSGSKTLQATVNIITRHPEDVSNGSLTLRSDTLGLGQQSLMAHGAFGKTNFYARFENTNNPGFDESTVTSSTGSVQKLKPLDGLNDQKLNLRASFQATENSVLDVAAGLGRGAIDIDTRDANGTGWKKEEFDSNYLNTSYKINNDNDEYKFGAYTNSLERTKEWQTCYPLFLFTDELRAMNESNPTYANTLIAGKLPTGGSAQDNLLAKQVLVKVASLGATARAKECGFINENYTDTRNVVNFENSHLFTQNFILTSGYEYQHNSYESQTFVAGTLTQQSHNLHATAHYAITDSLGVSGGGNYFRTKTEDREFDGKYSSHAGLNFDYLPNQTVKLVFSKTHREPDPLETHASWTYFMTDFSVPFDGKTEGYFYRTTRNVGAPVMAENFTTTELDFSGSLFQKHVEYDVKIFEERMDNLISQDLIYVKYAPTNDSFTKLRGYEFLIKYHINERLNFIVGGSDIHNDSTNVNEKSLTLNNAGYVSVMYTAGSQTISASYFGSNGIYDNSFDRFEVTARQRFSALGRDAYIQGRVRYEPSDYVSSLGQINAAGTGRDGSSATMEYSEKVSFMASVGISF
ncbi:MAG: hypothetical protein EOO52_13560 [Gammaproteobacteria bacterium]|nr:MAG: hypothetical protein EOO52_13560 [Gammaproteobacteria bacterium]